MEDKKKQRFLIEVEGMVPVKLKLETWAHDENEALKNLDNPRLCTIKERPLLDLPRLHRKRVTIKEAITSLLKLVKSF